MNKTRSKIETLKNDLSSSFENNVIVYKRAIIREIDYLWQTYKKQNQFASIKNFADYVMNFLNIPKAYRNTIVNDLNNAQTQIGDLWDEYFQDKTDLYKPVDYEKMVAAYSVDFPKIDKDVRNSVVKEVRNLAKDNLSYEVLRTQLQKTSLGTSEISNLANTALSQFDNASMFEFAQQAGINQFLYDGPVLLPNSHTLCIECWHKIFTYEEILQLDNGCDLPVVTSCGGYRCRHYWTAVV
jgi:hypothetical protein